MRTAYLLASLAAAIVPVLPRSGRMPSAGGPRFPGWPSRFEGRTLTPLPLSPREARFAAGFPGRMARFTDGQRDLILRWVTRPSRRLHPAADCLRGGGFTVTPRPQRRAWDGRLWGCVNAQDRSGRRYSVREQVKGADGRTWSDVPSWYWQAAFGRSHGPWWAVTVVTPVSGSEYD